MDEESFGERIRRLKARLGRKRRPREVTPRGWEQLMKVLERRRRGRTRARPADWSKIVQKGRERARTRR